MEFDQSTSEVIFLSRKKKFLEQISRSSLSKWNENPKIAKNYLKKRGYTNLMFSNPKQADYIIMTNRTLLVSGKLTAESTNKTVKIMNCFDRFKGEDVFKLKRNDLLLSVIRKKTNISDWN